MLFNECYSPNIQGKHSPFSKKISSTQMIITEYAIAEMIPKSPTRLQKHMTTQYEAKQCGHFTRGLTRTQRVFFCYDKQASESAMNQLQISLKSVRNQRLRKMPHTMSTQEASQEAYTGFLHTRCLLHRIYITTIWRDF